MECVAAAEITEGHYGNTAARAGRQSVADDDILISSLYLFINKIPSRQFNRSTAVHKKERKPESKKSLEQKKKQQGS